MLVWTLFIAVFNTEAVSTQQMIFQDQSSCERVGKRIVQAINPGYPAAYVCTQARIVK